MNDSTLTTTTPDPLNILKVDEEWLESQLYNGYRVWHILFFIMTVFFTLGIYYSFVNVKTIEIIFSKS